MKRSNKQGLTCPRLRDGQMAVTSYSGSWTQVQTWRGVNMEGNVLARRKLWFCRGESRNGLRLKRRESEKLVV